MFGLYGIDGSTSGEMCVRWKELGGKIVPQLQVFDDGWSALASFPDLILELGDLDNQNITPKEFCALLKGLGFKDLTARVNPYAPKEEKKAKKKKKKMCIRDRCSRPHSSAAVRREEQLIGD